MSPLDRDHELVPRCLNEAFEHRDGRIEFTSLDSRHRRRRDTAPRSEITCRQLSAFTSGSHQRCGIDHVRSVSATPCHDHVHP
jgi:hypothetical protein